MNWNPWYGERESYASTERRYQVSDRYTLSSFMSAYENSRLIQSRFFALCDPWAVLGSRATEYIGKGGIHYNCKSREIFGGPREASF